MSPQANLASKCSVVRRYQFDVEAGPGARIISPAKALTLRAKLVAGTRNTFGRLFGAHLFCSVARS